MKKESNFNSWLLNVLNWVGAIGAIITSIAYLVFIGVLVVGIETKVDAAQLLLISIVGAVAGLTITWMLRGQGIALAANEEQSKSIIQAYNLARSKKAKKKRLHTIKYHVTVSAIKDVLTKGIALAATTYFAITVFMEGNGDFSLIGLAIVNTLMFLSFGFLAMSKAYTYYVSEHLATLKELTIRLNDPIAVSSNQGDN